MTEKKASWTCASFEAQTAPANTDSAVAAKTRDAAIGRQYACLERQRTTCLAEERTQRRGSQLFAHVRALGLGFRHQRDGRGHQPVAIGAAELVHHLSAQVKLERRHRAHAHADVGRLDVHLRTMSDDEQRAHAQRDSFVYDAALVCSRAAPALKKAALLADLSASSL